MRDPENRVCLRSVNSQRPRTRSGSWQKIETTLGATWLSGVFVDRLSPFSRPHPSADCPGLLFSTVSPNSPPRPRPLSRTDNDVHYFLLLHRAQGNGRTGGEYGGCSLAPRRIIRCRYTITTFVPANWKCSRFFASNGRRLRFSKPTIGVFAATPCGENEREREREKARESDRLTGDKLYTLDPP